MVKTSKLYTELKTEREAAKKLLIERFDRPGATDSDKEIDLRRFMGRLGALSAKVSSAKVSSDHTPATLDRENSSVPGVDHQDQEQREEQGLQGRTRGRTRGRARGRGSSRGVRVRNGHAEEEDCGLGRGRGRVRGRGRERGVVYTRSPPHLHSPISISASRLDSVTEHINRHNLNLQHFGHVRSNGDCLYDSLYNLILHYNIEVGATDVQDLRKKIASHVRHHPNSKFWKQSVFKNQGRLMASFIFQHSRPGTFSDSDGLILHAAADLLDANINIVGSSNTDEVPVTVIPSSNPKFNLYIGYHQDETDRGGRAGHFVSLIKRPVVPVQQNLEKISAEKKILDLLFMEPSITSASLQRLKSIDMDLGSIKNSEILQTLDKMHSHYGRDTDNGALVRQIIRKINNVIVSSETWSEDCLEISVFVDEGPQELEIVDINFSSLEVVAMNQASFTE